MLFVSICCILEFLSVIFVICPMQSYVKGRDWQRETPKTEYSANMARFCRKKMKEYIFFINFAGNQTDKRYEIRRFP